jgi:ubiquitin-protein ligase
MRAVSYFENDFKEVTRYFPKLKYRKIENEKMWVVFGELEISDQVDDYWGTFDIEIELPNSYPYCVPLVKEISKVIKRDGDWHIDDDGYCCLDIEHKMLLLKKRGVNLTNFIKNKVYPYFANQIYKKNKGNYAAGEYLHNFEGVQQFYREELNIGRVELARNILQGIILKKLPERNEPCFCGERKFKSCHVKCVDFLRSMPLGRLKTDLDEFSKLVV